MNRYLYAGVLEELEEAQREKYEMDALVAQYGGMSAAEPSLRDQATGYLADGLQAVGLYDNNPRAAARTAGALTGVMDFLPGTGEALAAADAQNEFEQGNVGMGVLYAAGALPIVPAAATKAAGNAVKGLKAWHSGPNKIDGPFDLSDKDVGIHLADNEALATNAAVKSGFERGVGRDQMQTSPYLIDAGEDQIYDITASSNRFDAIDIVDELVAAGKIDAERGALMVDDILKLEDSPLEVNQYLRDNLEDASGIRALRYQNTFDAGPTWEDIELGVLESDVQPAPSYMIFNPDHIKGALEEGDEAADIGDRLHTFHRLSSDNLHHADRMGGMPMPSIGVGRVDAPYDGYGDIELIGPKTMAAPSARNPVFSSDAYSPTYPRVNYRFKEENVGALIDDLAPYTEKVDANPISLHMDMEDQLGNLRDRKDVLAKYLDEQGVNLPDDMDGYELHSWMQRQVSDDPKYDAYAREMFDALDAEERLFFGYTPSGNRRYKPHTLENALKYMKEDMRDNNQTGMFGAGALRAQVAPTFRTLEDVKGARDRISHRGDLTDMKEELNMELIDISSEFSDYAKYTDRNQFIAGDMHRDQLLEIAQGRADWDEYFPGAPEELKQRWTAYMEELKNAPTAYFEAKPQRIVTLDEFQGALIPADAPQEVEDILRRNSIERIERVTDEADRIAKMRKFQDLLFSVTGTAGAAGLLYNEQSDTASL